MPTQGQLSFNTNDTYKDVSVQVVGNTSFEDDEVFYMNLGNSSYGSIIRNRAQGTIRNDDRRSRRSRSATSRWRRETRALPTRRSPSVFRPPAPSRWRCSGTADGTATTADSDYQLAGGDLTFKPGDPLSKPLTVQVVGDTKNGPDETFYVNLSNASGDNH